MIIRTLFFWTLTVGWSFPLLASRPVRGIYKVPVQGHLKPYASFPVKFRAENYQDNPTEINFPLPQSLVGELTFIKLTKVNETSKEWTGPNASGLCDQNGRYFICQLAFKNLNFNSQKIEEAIRFEYDSPDEVAGRLEVAKTFSTEPIGIIIYKLKGHDH